MGEMLDESLKEYLKIEIRLYQVYVVFPLMRVRDDVVLLQNLSQSKGASRRMIIKLAIYMRELSIYMKEIGRRMNESDS